MTLVLIREKALELSEIDRMVYNVHKSTWNTEKGAQEKLVASMMVHEVNALPIIGSVNLVGGLFPPCGQLVFLSYDFLLWFYVETFKKFIKYLLFNQ